MHAKKNWVKGMKGCTPLMVEKKRQRLRGAEKIKTSQNKIDMCLNCKKSVKECKGNCVEVE